jgi:hypothetical protein
MSEMVVENVETCANAFAAERVEVQVGAFHFIARLEDKLAPKTCASFRSLLPLTAFILHCRWSGESLWVPFTPSEPMLEFENHTSYPSPGQLLMYAQRFSEPEILMPYGACSFSSKVGQLAGNHFLTIESGLDALHKVGHDVLWNGAHEISFRLLSLH